MYIFTEEYGKPLQCSECGSRDIAKMVNEGVLRCLNCKREKVAPNSMQEIMRREMGGNSSTWKPKKNPKPYREF